VVEVSKKITELADRFLEIVTKVRAAVEESFSKVVCT
jgi:hypothetical protein